MISRNTCTVYTKSLIFSETQKQETRHKGARTPFCGTPEPRELALCASRPSPVPSQVPSQGTHPTAYVLPRRPLAAFVPQACHRQCHGTTSSSSSGRCSRCRSRVPHHHGVDRRPRSSSRTTFRRAGGLDQPLTRTLHGPREERWAGIYVIAGMQPDWTSGMVAGVVLVGAAARRHAARACVRRCPALWCPSAHALNGAACSHVHVWMRECCGCSWAAVVLSSGTELTHGAGGWMRCSGAASGDCERAGGAPTLLHPCRVGGGPHNKSSHVRRVITFRQCGLRRCS